MKNCYLLVALISFAATTSGQRLDSELLLYSFQENSGDLVQDFGSLSNAPLQLQGADFSFSEDGGLAFAMDPQAQTTTALTSLSSEIQNNQSFSVECWFQSANNNQDGPARIITLSNGSSNRNFTIAQDGSAYVARVRTTDTDNNGLPQFETAQNMVNTDAIQHVVYTLSAAGQERFYLDGQLVSEGDRSGDLTNWNSTYRLAIGNEIGASRPWNGTFHLLAVHDRDLSEEEIQTLFAAGHQISLPDYSDETCPEQECWVTGFGADQRALWLPNLPDGIFKKFEFDEEGGHFEVFPDGRAHIYGNTINMETPEYGWYIDVWFTGRMNWNDWSALGRSWKGNPNIVGDLYETWDYYIMDEDEDNVLIGTGEYEGSTLYLTHRPADYNYGLQVGLAANDQNAEMGMSVWFDYSGEINGESVSHHGDINLEGGCNDVVAMVCPVDIEVECELGSYDPEVTGYPEIFCEEDFTLTYSDQIISQECPFIMERTFEITFTDGSTATCSQTISVSDEVAPVFLTVGESQTVDCADEWPEPLYEVTDNCDPDVEVVITEETLPSGGGCQLRTQTPGGWGAPAAGNNPGAYRDQHFDSVFPNGLTIGCDNYLTLNSASEVQAFLPSGGPSVALPNIGEVNPESISNTLAGHLVTLKLSVGFDLADANFGESNTNLAITTVASGPFQGWTVAELIQVADQVIGGCSSEYNPSDLTGVLSGINENFVDGTTDLGFLDCNDCVQTVLRTYTATDNCGNETTVEQILTLVDETPPVFENLEEDIYVPCGQIPSDIPTATDDCGFGDVTVTSEETTFSGACLPIIQRTFTATDACGNVTEFIQYIHLQDNVAPAFLSEMPDLTLSCGDAIPEELPLVIDDCSEATVTFSIDTISSACPLVLNQTFTAMDLCGGEAQLSRTLTFVDDVAPQAVFFPEDQTVSCDQLPSTELFFTDNCGDVSVEFLETAIGEGCEYLLSRSWIASDQCGNQTILNQTLTVIDEAPPVIEIDPAITVDCAAAGNLPIANITDNCSLLTSDYTEEIQPSSNGCYDLMRTWTATDACGNVSSATQVVTVENNFAPVLQNVPESGAWSCGDVNQDFDVTAIDACGNAIDVQTSIAVEENECVREYTYTFTAVDACGNASSASAMYTFSDSTVPVINASEEVFTTCSALQSDDLIEVIDDCVEATVIDFEDQILNEQGCDKTILRTWMASDACGNSTSFVQTIYLTDETAPVFTYVPEDVEVSCGYPLPVQHPLVEDECGEVTVQLIEDLSGTPCSQVLTRTWTATDECGNIAEATQTITITDDEAPEIIAEANDQTINCADNFPALPEVTVVDNCDSNASGTWLEEFSDGSCGTGTLLTRTFAASDLCGNTSMISYTIEIVDNEPPVFDQTLDEIFVECGQIPDPPMVTATDNCGEVNIDYSETSDSGGCPSFERIWVATDACGNTSFLYQTVNVEDTEPPVLEGIPSNIEVNCNTIPDMPEPDVSDNCDDEVAVTLNESIIGTGCEFTIIRTWIASDDCGNTTIFSQSINVIDESAPVFVDPPTEVTLSCTELEAYPYPLVFDDCDVTVNMSVEDEVLGNGCSYDVLRKYTAIDACGNSTIATVIFHVVDDVAPTITGVPANAFVDCDQVPDPAEVQVFDDCSDVSWSYNDVTIPSGDCAYIINRGYIATDACGNSTGLTQLIYVEDTSAPVLELDQPYVEVGCGQEWPMNETPSAMDNCSENIVLTSEEQEVLTSCGAEKIVTWTAVDECGNTSTIEQLFVRDDTEAPVFTSIIQNVNTTCDQIPAPLNPSVQDNCSNVLVTMEEETILGACPYEIRRTYTARDACGNIAEAVQSIYVTDVLPPVLEGVPADVTVGCGNVPSVVSVTASDDCADAFLIMEETMFEDGCSQVLRRTWTATDACGNTTTATQEITIVDESAPTFVNPPADMTMSCVMVAPMSEIAAVDDCSDLIQDMEEVRLDGDCPSEYTLIRSWFLVDGCGNEATHVQTIEVIDDTAPLLIGVPEDVTVTCDEIPATPVVEAMDQCGEDVSVVFVEQVDGEDPTECIMQNAEAFGLGIGMWIPGVDGLDEYYVLNPSGTITTNPADGTRVLTGELVSASNANHIWNMHIELSAGMDWDTWSNLGRDYKDETGYGEPHYQDWMYHVLDGENSSLVGAGDLTGSYLSLTHAPADLTYGFQEGWGANNRNENYGMSGWFFYNGQLGGETISGAGDVIIEINCCSARTIRRIWTATDCAGNSVSGVQVIEVLPDVPFNPLWISEPEDRNLQVSRSEGDWFAIEFNSMNEGKITMKFIDMAGKEVLPTEEKQVIKGGEYLWLTSKQGLQPGWYVISVEQDGRILSDVEYVGR